MRSGLRLIAISYRDFTRNNSSYMAAGIAYWMIVCLFPMALGGLALLAMFATDADEIDRAANAVARVLPVSETFIAQTIADTARARGALSAISIVGMLWTALSVFSAVRKGINHTWGIVKPPYFLLERGQDLLMMAGVGLLIACTALLGSALGEDSPVSALVSWLDSSTAVAALLQLGGEVLALGFTFAIFCILYRYLPNTRVLWREVWPGALAGAVVFNAARIIFAWTVGRSASFDLIYGSLGAAIAVLVWAFISANALLFGSQVAFTNRAIMRGDVSAEGERRKIDKAERKPNRPFAVAALSTVYHWVVPARRNSDDDELKP